MKKVIEYLEPLIVFFTPYPLWVKGFVIVWVLLSAILLVALIFVPRIGDQAGLADAYPKSQTLMAYDGEDSGVSVSLIEDIANSRDPRKKEYLESFRQVRTTKSLIEAEATDAALKAISKGTKLKDTHETLFEGWKKKNNFEDMEALQRLVFTVLYLKRTDSKTYQTAIDAVTKTQGNKEGASPQASESKK